MPGSIDQITDREIAISETSTGMRQTSLTRLLTNTHDDVKSDKKLPAMRIESSEVDFDGELKIFKRKPKIEHVSELVSISCEKSAREYKLDEEAYLHTRMLIDQMKYDTYKPDKGSLLLKKRIIMKSRNAMLNPNHTESARVLPQRLVENYYDRNKVTVNQANYRNLMAHRMVSIMRQEERPLSQPPLQRKQAILGK